MLFQSNLSKIFKCIQSIENEYPKSMFYFKMEILKKTLEYDYGFIWAISKTNSNNKYKLY